MAIEIMVVLAVSTLGATLEIEKGYPDVSFVQVGLMTKKLKSVGLILFILFCFL